jgi:hypothetical protein
VFFKGHGRGSTLGQGCQGDEEEGDATGLHGGRVWE